MPPKGRTSKTQSQHSNLSELPTDLSPAEAVSEESPRGHMPSSPKYDSMSDRELLQLLLTEQREQRIEVAELRSMYAAHIKATSTGGGNETKEAPKRAKGDTLYSWFLTRVQKDDVFLAALWEGGNIDIWPHGALKNKYFEHFKELPQAPTDADARLKLARNVWNKTIQKEERNDIESYREQVDPKPDKPKRGTKKAGNALPASLQGEATLAEAAEAAEAKPAKTKSTKAAAKPAAKKAAPKKAAAPAAAEKAKPKKGISMDDADDTDSDADAKPESDNDSDSKSE